MASLYDILGVARNATDIEVRRAYRNLATKLHPDKEGGSLERFRELQRAFEVLQDPVKRTWYDETGQVQRGADEEFMEGFASGSFRDRAKAAAGRDDATTAMADAIILRQKSADMQQQSHSAGFEAWLRARGEGGAGVFTADDVAQQFGVVKSSYHAVTLPRSDVFMVQCTGAGRPQEVLKAASQPLPAELEWGEVLVELKYAPINPADTYSSRLGGIYGADTAQPPFVAGHDGVGVVTKVGPGVKGLCEGDVVMPLMSTFKGTWRAAAVWREGDLLKVPPGLSMPLEYLAMSREMCVAYRLLEAYGNLKPGDCVILNAANSSVGQVVLQLCRLLKLRAVAVVRWGSSSSSSASAGAAGGAASAKGATATAATPAAVSGGNPAAWQRLVTWLTSLGATHVIKDEGSLKLELDALRFFSRPKLALDAVGGESAARLADALADGGELVCYGCMSGKPPGVQWQSYVFRELRVTGFNLRAWMGANRKRMLVMLEALSKLVRANMLTLNYTEYDLCTEFPEALEHAMEAGRNTKVLLRCSAPTGSQQAQPDAAATAP